MPISYYIDQTERVVYFRLEGNEPASAVIVAIKERALHPDLPSEGTMLIDLTNNRANPSSGELREILKAHTLLAKRLKGSVAMVATPGFRFGMARQSTLIGQTMGFDMKAFTSIEEAAEWLGIEHLPDEAAWAQS